MYNFVRIGYRSSFRDGTTPMRYLIVAIILFNSMIAYAIERPKVVYPVSTVDIATFESDEGWSGAGTAADTVQVKKGSQSRSITSTGTIVTSGWVYSQTRNFSDGKYFECWVFVPKPSNTLGVSLFLVRDTGAVNYLRKDWTSGLQYGWNLISAHLDEFTSNGTSADISAIAQVRVGTQSVSGSNTVYFDHCRNIKRVPYIFLEVDDGLITTYSIFAPKVEAMGWKFSFWIVTSKIGVDSNYATWAELNDLEDRGHNIGVHFHLNQDYGDGVGDDSAAGVESDMRTAIATLKANGINGYNGLFDYAASQGRVTTISDGLQRKIFLSGRRNTYPGGASNFGTFSSPYHSWEQWGFMPVASTLFSAFESWVNEAISEQRNMAIVYHCFNPALDTNCVEPTMVDDMFALLKQKENQGFLRVVPRRYMNNIFLER